MRQALAVRVRGDVEDQQCRGDREDAVGEGFEPRSGHRTKVQPRLDSFLSGSSVTFAEMDAQCCLACGEELSEPLLLAGSLRCQDCRDADEPLDPELCVRAEEREAA